MSEHARILVPQGMAASGDSLPCKIYGDSRESPPPEHHFRLEIMYSQALFQHTPFYRRILLARRGISVFPNTRVSVRFKAFLDMLGREQGGALRPIIWSSRALSDWLP